MNKLLFCVIFIFEFIGCAGIAKYQDDTFIYTGSKEFEVALIPLKTGMPIELYSQLDTFFTIVFKDTASGRKIIPSYELFTETENKPPLDPRIAYRIRGYEIKDYKTHRLYDILDEQDMKQLHNSIPNSIFLIVPIIFEIDNTISPNGYFYILVWNGRATICTTTSRLDMFKGISKLHQKNLKLDICKNILKGSKKRHEFSGFANYNVPRSAVEDKRIYAGEAAGFQDAFLGFGMKYAFISGYLAAKSIIDNISYDYLWKKAFGHELKKTSQPRIYMNIFGNKKYEDMIERMKKYNGSYRSMLKNIYTDYNILSELTCRLIR